MRYLPLFFVIAVSYSSYAKDNLQSCDKGLDDLPSAPTPEIVVSQCLDETECWMGFKIKNEHEGFVFEKMGVEREQKPKMFLELDAFQNGKDKGTRLSGELTFFDGLTI